MEPVEVAGRMNAFTIAATALLAMLAPLGFVTMRRRPIDGVVALQLASAILVLVLLCFSQGFNENTYFDVPVVAAVVSWVGGLIYARFLGRWL